MKIELWKLRTLAVISLLMISIGYFAIEIFNTVLFSIYFFWFPFVAVLLKEIGFNIHPKIGDKRLIPKVLIVVCNIILSAGCLFSAGFAFIFYVLLFLKWIGGELFTSGFLNALIFALYCSAWSFLLYSDPILRLDKKLSSSR